MVSQCLLEFRISRMLVVVVLAHSCREEKWLNKYSLWGLIHCYNILLLFSHIIFIDLRHVEFHHTHGMCSQTLYCSEKFTRWLIRDYDLMKTILKFNIITWNQSWDTLTEKPFICFSILRYEVRKENQIFHWLSFNILFLLNEFWKINNLKKINMNK